MPLKGLQTVGDFFQLDVSEVYKISCETFSKIVRQAGRHLNLPELAVKVNWIVRKNDLLEAGYLSSFLS